MYRRRYREKTMKIVVTGGSGLVGANLKKYISDAIYLSSADYDLTCEQHVINMYKELEPDCIIHLAAKVGGIIDNINNPAPYFTENILMNTLLVKYAHAYNVKKFIGVLSTCIYPDVVETYPLDENMLHLGPPTPTNFSYGYAKRCLGVQIDAYNTQYNTQYSYLIPCNLFGEGDKHGNNSHFVTALIKKIWQAKQNNDNSITLFGDGTPLRQFMHVDDFCNVIKFVIDNNITESFNVATNETLTIKEIAEIALDVCDATHLSINWDTTMPNGQLRKDVSISKLTKIFPEFGLTTLRDGIRKTYDKFGQ
jgi:GDP-L-fucose synthase